MIRSQDAHARSGKLSFLILFVTFASIGAATVSLRYSLSSRDDSLGLEISPSALDFGKVWEAKDFQCTLPLQNVTESPIEITHFAASCECVSVLPSTLVIPARERRVIVVTINLTSKRPQERRLAVRQFETELRPQISGKEALQTAWTIHGLVGTALEPDLENVNFGTCLVQGLPYKPITVKLHATMPLDNVRATCAPGHAQLDISRSQADAQTFTLTVTPLETIPLGPFSFTVRLQPIGAVPENAATRTITVSGEIMDHMQAFPGHIVLGAHPLGTSIEETVVLKSLKELPMEVVGIDDGNLGIAVRPLPAARDGHQSFIIKQNILELGSHSGLVSFHARFKDGATCLVPLRVTYFGIERINASAQ